jgi:DASS family divalent anion:Na+ symporter
MHANQISSAIFLTAMASNLMTQKFMADVGVGITWGEWFLMALAPGMVCMLLSPWLIYKLAPPELKAIPQAKAIAQKQLEAMPPMAKNEIKTICVFGAMLLFWIMGSFLKIHTALVAIGGLCVLLITKVLDVEDITEAKEVWNIVIWLSIFNLLAWKLTQFGLINHYSAMLKSMLAGYCWPAALIVISIIYYLGRYILPGNTIHACAMFPAFAQLLIACGVPAKIGCMALAFITSYCGYVTPYATSPCPIIFNTGYISLKLWWKIGLIAGFFYSLVWFFIGGAWWKVLGIW